MRLCLNCHVAIMEPHKEYLWVRKCPVCSFSEVEPNKDSSTKVPSLAALDAIQQQTEKWFAENSRKT